MKFSHYLCSVFHLEMRPKIRKRGEINEFKGLKIMNKTLLHQVDDDNLDRLLDAVGKVLCDMNDAEPNKEVRYKDETYMTALRLSSMIFETIRKKFLEKEGK